MTGAIGGVRDYISIPIRSSNDFSGTDKIGRAVTRGGEFADTGMEAVGVCMENVGSGQIMKVGIWGLLKFRPINVVSANYGLTVTTSGFFLAQSSANYKVGMSIGNDGVEYANTVSNALSTAFLDFSSKTYVYPGSSNQVHGA